jgi:hypothetical protein
MSASASAEESSELAPPVARLTDFADWLSPMVVKELRQGLRGRGFVMAFTLLQAVLALIMLFSLQGVTETGSFYFWIMAAVLIAGVMPLSGFGALTDEIQDGTLDLLMVTKLTATKIAIGKWCALVAQTLLMCITILPYVVMRYFAGEVDLPSELILLEGLLLLSCVLSALTISFSVFPSFLVRAAVALIGGSIAYSVVDRLFYALIAHSGSGTLGILPGILALPLTAFVCWFLLELGASRIAPQAENHATRKRLASLTLAILVGPVAYWGFGRPTENGMILLFLGGIAIIDALTEPISTNGSVIGPFVRKGVVGKFFGRLLYPGWCSGVWFSLLLAAIYALGDLAYLARMSAQLAPDSGGPMITRITLWTAWIGIALFPIPLIRIFFRRVENRFGYYMLIQLAVAAICCGVLLVSASTDKNYIGILAMLFPHGVVAAIGTGHPTVAATSIGPILVTSGIVTSMIAGASVVVAIKGFREIREAEQELVERTNEPTVES